jgi:uncharacterized membrane protein
LTRTVLKLFLRRHLIAGLLVWLPIIATVAVIRFILNLMDGTLLLLPHALQPEVLIGVHVPGLGLLLAVLILLATGLLVTNIFGRGLVRAWEDLMNRIPFVRGVYGGVKSFSTTLLTHSGQSFKKVLLVQYPRAGLWSIGFQTAPDLRLAEAQGDEPQVCVFIPTTPNPTSGFIVLVPRSQAVELDISVEAAMKMIVTLGVVTPAAHAAEEEQALRLGAGAAAAPPAPAR